MRSLRTTDSRTITSFLSEDALDGTAVAHMVSGNYFSLPGTVERDAAGSFFDNISGNRVNHCPSPNPLERGTISRCRLSDAHSSGKFDVFRRASNHQLHGLCFDLKLTLP